MILDSGFCVLKGIIELRKKGVFAAALIKKRRYWPKYVPCQMIVEKFKDNEVGHQEALKGVFENIDFHIFVMKEPDYTMQMMSTYGTTEHVGEEKRQICGPKESRQQKMIWYSEVVHNHFKYRHAVDDHNNRRQSPISLEETWATKWWPHRVHAFFAWSDGGQLRPC